MNRLLRRAGWRYHLRHKAQWWLMLTGVALGVAVVVAVDVANVAAERALRWSVDALSSAATHEIVGGPRGVDESVYTQLRLAGWRDIAPRIEGKGRLSAQNDLTVTVLGADLLAAGESERGQMVAGVAGDALRRLLIEPNTVAISARLAERWQFRLGDRLTLSAGGATHQVDIVALFSPRTETAAYGLEHVIVADIATAQELLGMRGRLSRIEVSLPSGEDGEQAAARLRALLPPGTTLLGVEQRRDNLLRLSDAFRLNLQAFSLLSLAVGMLLIYNAFTFSVVQRRPVLARLRALGVTRIELARMILGEAAILGVAGAIFGVAAGYLLGQGVLRQVAGTMNDLYFTVAATDVPLPATAWLKGAVLGMVTSLVAAALPMWEAVSAPVQLSLGRVYLEARVRRGVPKAAAIGALVFVSGMALLWLEQRSLTAAFVALFAMMLGAALFIPFATLILMTLLRPVAKTVAGMSGGMAARGVVVSLSRTGVAVAALAVAVAATVGVTVMIDSFRQSVTDWLAHTLRADIYISANGGALAAERVAHWAALAEVSAISIARRVILEQETGPVELFALAPAPGSFAGFRFKEGDAHAAWPAFLAGEAVLISESYAYRHALGAGDAIALRTAHGERRFPIAGVYYDYGSEQGTVTLSRAEYEKTWDDPLVTSAALYVAPGVDTAALVERLQREAGDAALTIRSNRDLRDAALQIFERTFAVTGVLRTLVIMIAAIAMLGALAALILERAREWAVLRALGMLRAQLWGLVSGEAVLMGLAAGLFALPLGLGVAYVLTQMIQPRAFGWTMGFSVEPLLLAQTLLFTVLAAVAAALYPAWRVARAPPAENLWAE